MDRASTNLQITVIGCAVLLVVGAAVWFGWPSTEPPVPDPVAVATTGPDRLTVHVSGAVVRPGVVEVDGGSRVARAVEAAGGATAEADLGAMNLAAALRDGDHVVVPVAGEDRSADPGVSGVGIDINTATATELETLPGVGPVLAERIVAFRDERGRFGSVEDLLDVPGIGEAKLAQLRESISSP